MSYSRIGVKSSMDPWKKIKDQRSNMVLPTLRMSRWAGTPRPPNGWESMLTIVSWYRQRNGWVSALTMGDSARIGAPQYNGLPQCSPAPHPSLILHWLARTQYGWVVSSQYKRAYKTYNSSPRGDPLIDRRPYRHNTTHYTATLITANPNFTLGPFCSIAILPFY